MSFADELAKLQRTRRAYVRFALALNSTPWPIETDRQYQKVDDSRGDVPARGTVVSFGSLLNHLANHEFPLDVPTIQTELLDPENEWRTLGDRPSNNLMHRKLGYYVRQHDDNDDILDQLIAIGQIAQPSYPSGKVRIESVVPGGEFLGENVPRRLLTTKDWPRSLPDHRGRVIPFIYGSLVNSPIPIAPVLSTTPVSVKYLRFAKSTSTGVQTISTVGFRGKALILWSTMQTAAGLTTAAEMCNGMTDGIRQSCRYIRHPGAEATTTSAQDEQTDHIFRRVSATSGAAPTVQVAGIFTGWTDTGFQINWLTNDSDAVVIHALVIGGASVQASFTQLKVTVSAPSTQAKTGVGFQPDSFIVMGGAADEFGAGDYSLGAPWGSIHGFGFSNASENVCGWTLGRGTGGASDNNKGQHTDRVSSIRVGNLTGAAELMGMRITSRDADGYTITRDVGSSSQPVQHVLCLKGVEFALGAFNTPGATGDYALALPFTPSLLMAQTLGAPASGSMDGMGLAVGAWDATGSGGSWIGGTDNANPSVYRRAHYESTFLQSRQASDGAVQIEATVASTSGSGATLNFSTVPSPAQQIIYMALAPVEA